MNGYCLLSSNQIPNCCGSCKSLRLIPTKMEVPPFCRLTRNQICLFGICGLFKRRNML
jgi:hypothetical protein